MTTTITGVKEVDRALASGDRKARRAGRKAVNAGQTVLRQSIRAAVPEVGKPGTKRRLQQSVRSRNKRNRRTGVQEAKTGLGVGKPRGQAIHPNLVHLFGLGTAERHSRRGYRGRMTPIGAVPRGAAAAESAVAARMRQKLAQELERENRKR